MDTSSQTIQNEIAKHKEIKALLTRFSDRELSLLCVVVIRSIIDFLVSLFLVFVAWTRSKVFFLHFAATGLAIWAFVVVVYGLMEGYKEWKQNQFIHRISDRTTPYIHIDMPIVVPPPALENTSPDS